jgi:hypothetical protein
VLTMFLDGIDTEVIEACLPSRHLLLQLCFEFFT